MHKLRDPRVKNNLQVMLEERLQCVTAGEPEEQWKQMKTILQETTTEVVGLSTRKTKTGLTKQIRKSKSCSNRNAPATIICLQNLMIKLPRLHTRLPAVHSRPRLGPCRIIGGQDLPRGHNGMLTWVTWAPSTRRLWTLISDPSPSTLFGWKYPADKQGSHSPALVRAF